MSDTTPELQPGDKVRVMQTDEMIRDGLANQVGRVLGVSGPLGRPVAKVALRSLGITVTVETHSLMKVSGEW